MSTRKQRDDSPERFWRRVVRQWRHSGLSVRAFCADHGLAEPSFYHWRRTLRERDASHPAFVPVRVIADETPPGPDGAVELVLGGGRVLRLGPGFDAGTVFPGILRNSGNALALGRVGGTWTPALPCLHPPRPTPARCRRQRNCPTMPPPSSSWSSNCWAHCASNAATASTCSTGWPNCCSVCLV